MAAISLPTTATTRRIAASRSTESWPKLETSTSMPMARKKTGMKRCPTGASSRRMRSRLTRPAEREPGDEGADDDRQVGDVGELGERQREREGQRDQRAGRPRSAFDPAEEVRREPERDQRPRRRGTRARRARISSTLTIETVPSVTIAHHDGEHDEAHHVVGHRGAEHHPRLGCGERAEIAEDPGGDAHAGRGQRGGDEQRGVEVVADGEHGAEAEHERRDHADGRDLHRDLARPCPSSPRSISMPTSSSRSTTPSSPSVRSTSPLPTSPSTDGPTTMPATISPTTAGSRMRSAISAAALAATRTTRMSRSTEMTSWDIVHNLCRTRIGPRRDAASGPESAVIADQVRGSLARRTDGVPAPPRTPTHRVRSRAARGGRTRGTRAHPSRPCRGRRAPLRPAAGCRPS